MKQSALQQYTKQNKLYGQNSVEILEKFTQYANLCSDPMSVYKYMEQKSICIYLANYWTNRAILFAQMGDFRDALLCLKEATSRNHIVNENQVKIEQYVQKIKKKMITAMKRVPPKSKRSVNEYTFMYEKQNKMDVQSLQKLIQKFQKNYKEAKKEIEKQFDLKCHGKGKSWMSSIYEQNEQNIRKLSQKMKSLNNIQTFLSMRTPISKKDPMRLTKTMDSVEMLKKKKSTQPKQNKKKRLGQNINDNKQDDPQNKNRHMGQNSDDNQDNQETPICVNTTPVGRQLSMLSRRVTFDTKMKNMAKIEKIRKQEIKVQQKQSNSLQRPQKNEISEEQNVNKSKSISKRGSILKNKKIQAEPIINMEQEN